MRLLGGLLLGLVAVDPLLTSALPSPACKQVSTPSWRKITDRLVTFFWSQEIASHRDNCAASQGRSPGASIPAVGSHLNTDTVLRFNLSTFEEARAIAEASEDLYLDIWEFNDNWVDIRLAKGVVPSLLGLLPDSLQNAHSPLIPDAVLTELLHKPYTLDHHQHQFSPSLRTSSRDLFFADYQPMSVIEPWMRLLSSLFSTHVKLISIGLTYEGREIPALKVGVHPTNDAQPSSTRKTVIVSGGLHAREWISTTSVNYVAHQLIIAYGKDKHVTKLLERFDFIFIPTLNPDGYVYAWETDRFWRKNRQPTSLRFCHGIDLDRAFGYQWDGLMRVANPCSESYAGEEAWEATEAKAFAKWTKNETENNGVEFVAMLDLHSYSQQVLYPYSYSCAKVPPSLENLEEVAMGLAKAMRTAEHGHTYRARSACEGNVYLSQNGDNGEKRAQEKPMPRMELGGGSLLDYAYHDLKIEYAYQVKLRDMGSYGFLLPKENIVPQGKELMSAINYLGKFLLGDIGFFEHVEQEAHHETESDDKGGDGARRKVLIPSTTLDTEVDHEVYAAKELNGDDVTSQQFELKRRKT